MLAAYARATGGDDPVANLEVGEQPEPEARPGWAVLRVEAASLNHHDLWTLKGLSSHPITPPQILGCDAAGTIAAYGPDPPEQVPPAGSAVLAHAVIGCGRCPVCLAGEELFCTRLALLSDAPYPGTLAEFVAVPAANLIPRPEAISAAEAACLPTAYLTAYRMLFTRARLQPGHSVLVQGASGGVATAAILLARAAGVAVIATSRDPTKRRQAIDLGATAALAPDREALSEIQALSGGGVDAVIETVGEPTWELSVRSLRPGGAVVVAGATGGDRPPLQLRRIFWRQLAILGSTMGTRAELGRLVQFCLHSGVRPLIDRTFPLSRAAEAFAALAAGERRGKLVILPG
jgi:NADPH:quinone reductase-like Zn-dependent oxidoreductase